ncbi:hypothetical protein D3C81_2115110 [compost metagenome]
MFLHEVFVLFGCIECVSQRRKSTRYDGDFGDFFGTFGRLGDQCMPTLVIGDDTLLFGVDTS